MKYILLLLMIFQTSLTFGNEIDQLNSTEDVQNYISTIDIALVKKFPHVTFRLLKTDSIYESTPCKDLFKQSDVQNWEKADLTNDGRTDLQFILSNGTRSYTFLIYEKKEGEYVSTLLAESNCEFLKPLQIKGKNFLRSFAIQDYPYSEEVVIDTLAFKFGGLVKKQTNPANYNIQSISYNVSGSEVIPHIQLKINRNGNGTYTQDFLMRNKKKNNFNIVPGNFMELEDLLEYIRIKDLKEDYAAPILDGAQVNLSIRFSDNSVKRISDYGGFGTRDLIFLYKKLNDLILKIK